MNIVDHTDQEKVHKNMIQTVKPTEIASIHFGNKNFKEFEILTKIDGWTREG
jgi:hypothetical protein